MPSSPERGPSSTSTLTLSTSRRASATALSGVASEQPKESRTGRPAIVAPVTWSCGFVPAAVPPAFLTSAYLAPEKASASKRAKGPPQVVRTPILMACPPEPPGAVLAVFAGALDAGALDVFEPLEPHPAATSATAAARSGSGRTDIRRERWCSGMGFSSLETHVAMSPALIPPAPAGNQESIIVAMAGSTGYPAPP